MGILACCSLIGIVHSLDTHRIFLFGSFACGSPTSDSDVYRLVIMEMGLTAGQRYLAGSRLLDPRPFPVDTLVKTPDEIEMAMAKGFFIQDIMSTGLVLYERPD